MGHLSSKSATGSGQHSAQKHKEIAENSSVSHGEFILVRQKTNDRFGYHANHYTFEYNGLKHRKHFIPNAISVPNLEASSTREFWPYGNKHALTNKQLNTQPVDVNGDVAEPENLNGRIKSQSHDRRRYSMTDLFDDKMDPNADELTRNDIEGIHVHNKVLKQISCGCISSAQTHVSEDSAISLRHDGADKESTTPSSTLSLNSDELSIRRMSHTDSDAGRFSAFLPESTSSSLKGAQLDASAEKKSTENLNNNCFMTRDLDNELTQPDHYGERKTSISLCSVTTIDDFAFGNMSCDPIPEVDTLTKHNAHKMTRPSSDSSSDTIANSDTHENSFETNGSDISSISTSKRAFLHQAIPPKTNIHEAVPPKVDVKVGNALTNYKTVLTIGNLDDTDSVVSNDYNVTHQPLLDPNVHPSGQYNTDNKKDYSDSSAATIQIRKYIDEQDALKLFSDIPGPPSPQIKARVPDTYTNADSGRLQSDGSTNAPPVYSNKQTDATRRVGVSQMLDVVDEVNDDLDLPPPPLFVLDDRSQIENLDKYQTFVAPIDDQYDNKKESLLSDLQKNHMLKNSTENKQNLHENSLTSNIPPPPCLPPLSSEPKFRSSKNPASELIKGYPQASQSSIINSKIQTPIKHEEQADLISGHDRNVANSNKKVTLNNHHVSDSIAKMSKLFTDNNIPINGRGPAPLAAVSTIQQTGAIRTNEANVSHGYEPVSNRHRNPQLNDQQSSIGSDNPTQHGQAPILSIPKVVEAKVYPTVDKKDSVPSFGYQLNYSAYNKALREHKQKMEPTVQEESEEIQSEPDEWTSAAEEKLHNEEKHKFLKIKDLQEVLMKQASPYTTPVSHSIQESRTVNPSKTHTPGEKNNLKNTKQSQPPREATIQASTTTIAHEPPTSIQPQSPTNEMSGSVIRSPTVTEPKQTDNTPRLRVADIRKSLLEKAASSSQAVEYKSKSERTSKNGPTAQGVEHKPSSERTTRNTPVTASSTLNYNRYKFRS